MCNLKNFRFRFLVLGFLIFFLLYAINCTTSNSPSGSSRNSQKKGIVIETHDGGATWDDPYKVKEAKSLKDACMLGYQNTIIAVGSNNDLEGAIFKTLDMGETWEEVFSDTSCNTFRSITSLHPGPIDGSGIVIGDKGILYRTSDYFSRWYKPNLNISDGLEGIDFFHDIELVGVAVGYDGAILRSEDGGYTWNDTLFEGFRFHDVSTVGVYSDSAIVLIACVTPYSTILRSDDAGITWSEIEIPSPVSEAIYSVYFTPETRLDGMENFGLAVGHGGYVYKSTDKGLTWEVKSNNDVNNQPLYDVAIGLDGNCVAVGWTVILHSSDYGETWSKAYNNGNYAINSIYFRDECSLYGFAVGGEF